MVGEGVGDHMLLRIELRISTFGDGCGGLGAEGLQEESSAFRRWVVEEGAARGPRVLGRELSASTLGAG